MKDFIACTCYNIFYVSNKCDFLQLQQTSQTSLLRRWLVYFMTPVIIRVGMSHRVSEMRVFFFYIQSLRINLLDVAVHSIVMVLPISIYINTLYMATAPGSSKKCKRIVWWQLAVAYWMWREKCSHKAIFLYIF